MSNKPSIYAHCPAGCEWETVHKEDLGDGTFKPLSSQGVNNQNDNTNISKWVGTQAEYDAEFGDTPPLNTEVTITDETVIYVSKKLLWSGNVNVKYISDFVMVNTFNTSFEDKIIEIELNDPSGYLPSFITLSLKNIHGIKIFSATNFQVDSLDSSDLFEIKIRCDIASSSFTIDAKCTQTIINFTNNTTSTVGHDCYVTAIYEIDD